MNAVDPVKFIRHIAQLLRSDQLPELIQSASKAALFGFGRSSQCRFGFDDPGLPIEVVTLEVRGALAGSRFGVPAAPRGAAPRPARARVREAGRWLEAALWAREALPAGFAARGPVIVTEEGATFWVAPGWRVRLHPGGALVATR